MFKIDEVEKLRQSHERIFVNKNSKVRGYKIFDVEIKISEGIACAVEIFGGAELRYLGGTASLSVGGSGEILPRQRTQIQKLESIRILRDDTSLEIFLNGGEQRMSADFYPRCADGIIKFFNMTAWVDIWNVEYA